MEVERPDLLPAEMFERLRRRYDHPPRHYHTVEHAATVARRARDLGGDRACLLAAWFHDAVYDPEAADNEERSAAVLSDWLPADPDVDEAARLVRLTATHDPVEGDTQGEILCDADLAVLGGSTTDYESYRAAIRREYARVSDAQWRAGRSAVLEAFLARDRIFRTPKAFERWETAARHNLTAELAGLAA